MRKALIAAFAMSIFATLAVAQSPMPMPPPPPPNFPPPPTAQDRVISTIASDIGRCRIDTVTMSVNLETVQVVLGQAQGRIKELEGALAQAQARIKELEPKAQPPAETPPAQ